MPTPTNGSRLTLILPGGLEKQFTFRNLTPADVRKVVMGAVQSNSQIATQSPILSLPDGDYYVQIPLTTLRESVAVVEAR